MKEKSELTFSRTKNIGKKEKSLGKWPFLASSRIPAQPNPNALPSFSNEPEKNIRNSFKPLESCICLKIYPSSAVGKVSFLFRFHSGNMIAYSIYFLQ